MCGQGKYKLIGGSGGMLRSPGKVFRNVGLPWTTFRAFSWLAKRERQCRVVKRKSQSQVFDLTQNNGCMVRLPVKWPAK